MRIAVDVRIELLGSEDAVTVGPAELPHSFAAETEAFLALVRGGRAVEMAEVP
jgi:hypothetical protein